MSPSHASAPTGCTVTVGNDCTVRTAAALVTVLHAFETTTSKVPLFPGVAGSKVSAAPVAPTMSTPSLRH